MLRGEIVVKDVLRLYFQIPVVFCVSLPPEHFSFFCFISAATTLYTYTSIQLVLEFSASGHVSPRSSLNLLTNLRMAVTVRFKPVGSAPILRTLVFKISASMKFETVVNFLRKKLDCKPTDSVFLYVNSVFAPGLDEGVGNLFRASTRLLCATVLANLGFCSASKQMTSSSSPTL
jgi:Ubiquitin-like autophagy protein Apg12